MNPHLLIFPEKYPLIWVNIYIYISARSVIASTFWSLALHESNSLGLYELYGGTYL